MYSCVTEDTVKWKGKGMRKKLEKLGHLSGAKALKKIEIVNCAC